MDKLIEELKSKIAKTLNLGKVDADNLQADSPLLGGALGIDSIDVLEMVIMIEKDYEVKIDNRELGEKVFSTLKTLADHISTHSPGSYR